MAFLTLILLIPLGPVIQAPDSSILQRSQFQVQYYVKSINNRNETDLNLWALAEVGKNKSQIRNFIKSYIEQQNLKNSILDVFRDTSLTYTEQLKDLTFKAHSPLLLVACLLAESGKYKQRAILQDYKNDIGFQNSGDIQYRAVVDALLSHKKITKNLLPADHFYPLHFILFSNSSIMRAGTFSQDYLNTAIDSWSFSGKPSIEQSLGIIALFRILFPVNNFKKIEQLYSPFIQDRLFPNSTMKLKLLRVMDYSMYRLGYYNRCLNIIRNYSLPLANYLGEKEVATKIRVSEGAYLYKIGKINESKEIYLDILNQRNLEKSSVSEARIYNNLAINYWKSGEFDKYIKLQFQSLNKAKNTNNYEVQLHVLKNLFTHYSVNKNFTSAKEYLQKAKELARQHKNQKDLAQLSYYEGQLYRDAESNYDEAITAFNHALGLITLSDYYSSYQNILIDKARILEKQKHYGRSKSIYQQVILNAQKRDDRRNAYYAAFNKANIYLKLNKTDSARIILDSLKTDNLDALDFYQLVKAKTVQTRYLQKVGQQNEGTQLLQAVIEQIVNRSRESGTMETGFWQIEPEYLNAFELYANLLINSGRTNKAVEVLDRLKTINDVALYQNPLVRSRVLNEKELSEYKRLTDQLDDLRRQLLAAKSDQKDKIKQQIDELSAQKSALDRKINSNSNTKPVTVKYIQRRMDAHQRVLHITELNDMYYLAIISRTNVHFKKIPITPDLRTKFKKSITELAEGKTDLTNLYTFTQLLGLDSLPSQVDQLTIIPDSYLYQLPLDVLPLSSPEKAYSFGEVTYLIERYETNYMTSLNDFNKSSSKTSYKYGFAGYGVSSFGNDRTALIPLPEAKTEIKSITDKLTALNDKRTFINDEATEQNFRQVAPNARILHLATHSKVNNQDPMFSSIYLRRPDKQGQTSGQRFPGRIFAYELFDLNLSNELVMMNSCESGSGSYLQGTGVVGISRALRYAGAKSLVLNLWSVNDMMASKFAVKFYDAINRGETKAEALRQTKLYFLKNKNSDPHYWGSYMLLGNTDAIVHPYQKTNQIVAGSFMIFFFSLALASSFVEIRERCKKNV